MSSQDLHGQAQQGQEAFQDFTPASSTAASMHTVTFRVPDYHPWLTPPWALAVGTTMGTPTSFGFSHQGSTVLPERLVNMQPVVLVPQQQPMGNNFQRSPIVDDLERFSGGAMVQQHPPSNFQQSMSSAHSEQSAGLVFAQYPHQHQNYFQQTMPATCLEQSPDNGASNGSLDLVGQAATVEVQCWSAST